MYRLEVEAAVRRLRHENGSWMKCAVHMVGASGDIE